MAATLAKRIEGLTAAESEPFIRDWFHGIRHMAHGAWIHCNIQSQSVPLGVPLSDEEERGARQRERMNGVMAILGKAGARLDVDVMEQLFNVLK